MKYMFASDIHGSAYYCEKMLEAYQKEKADRLVLLGDLLYHGPRNDLPRDYAPKQVIAMLNQWKEHLYVVRGNCDAEVDQMVLQFPIMADYCILMDGQRTIYCSHGHVYNEENLPPMKMNQYAPPGSPQRPQRACDWTLCKKQGRLHAGNPKNTRPPGYHRAKREHF